MKSKTNPLFFILFFIVVVFAALFFWNKFFPNKPNQAPENIEQKPKPVELYNKRNVTEEDDYTIINIEYPYLLHAAGSFSASVESFISSLVAEHKEMSEENWKARFKTKIPGETISEKPAHDDKFQLNGSFKVVQINDNVASILFSYDGYTGGAHGYQNLVTYNYDFKNQKEISFADFLKMTNRDFATVQAQVRDQLILKYAASVDIEDKEYNESIKQDILDGTGSIDDFALFTFKEDGGATVYFGQYQVGPYAIGIPEVEI